MQVKTELDVIAGIAVIGVAESYDSVPVGFRCFEFQVASVEYLIPGSRPSVPSVHYLLDKLRAVYCQHLFVAQGCEFPYHLFACFQAADGVGDAADPDTRGRRGSGAVHPYAGGCIGVGQASAELQLTADQIVIVEYCRLEHGGWTTLDAYPVDLPVVVRIGGAVQYGGGKLSSMPVEDRQVIDAATNVCDADIGNHREHRDGRARIE